MFVCSRVPKKPEFLKPDPTRIFEPTRVPDPKKPEPKEARPDPNPNFGFRVFLGIDPKNPNFLMGGSRRKTPIEIDLRDFRHRRQSHKSIIMNSIRVH